MSSAPEAAGGRAPTDAWERRGPVIAWAVFGLSMAGTATTIALEVLNGQGSSVLLGIPYLTFPVVGLLLATRRPRNPLGWLMIAVAFLLILPGESYARYAEVTRHGELPGAALALAITSPLWVPFIGLSGYILLLFPDGHLPTPRWRWFAWVCGVGLALLALVILLEPADYADIGFPDIENPLGIRALEPYLGPLLVLVVFAPLTVLGGAVGLIRRLRRTTDPVQRQQLRWLAWAAGVIATGYLLAFVPQLVFGSEGGSAWEEWLGTVAVTLFALIPVTIGMAVLRYRLYDIDVVIKKTVVFAVIGAFIAAVYVAVVIGVGAIVGSRSSPFLSALAAAIVALVFQPLRARARRLADRVVYGRRATPYEVLAEFGDQLATTFAADDVLPRIARVLAEGVGAERARVYLRAGEELRPVATWPPDADDARADDATVEVRHRGEALGALSVAMPANDPMDPAKERLVTDLAAQAGLVLRNVRLTEDLRARLEELSAAQRRIVAAQDAERRRLERNIHDGAQQQLVAMSVKLGLLERIAGDLPPKAGELLGQLQEESRSALEDLRDLARGIYPPLLADKGLPEALQAQARKSTTQVVVSPDGVGRYPQEVEAAVYFSVLEALQNVAKYAGATRAEVRLWEDGDALGFEVVDDGRGFDPSATGYGTGLQGIADRLSALDGSLEVTSVPGGGTTVRGSVPVARSRSGAEAATP